VVLIAAVVLALAPAAASATSPVLEFVIPGSGFPVSFIADGGEVTAEMTGFETAVHCAASHGEGEVTGPRSTLSTYVFTGCETQGGADGGRKCKSEGANEEEIATPMIEAELVYISQAKHEVGILLDPHAGVYMNFECGGESVEALGPFLSPVGPINQQAMSFTATLSHLGAMQTPYEYENANGEKIQAIPMGKRGAQPLVTTGVELSFTISPTLPLEIKAITVAELEAKRLEEEAAAAAKKHQEEEATAAAAAKKRQEEEAATAAAAKKRQEEEAATAAAAKKRQEEEAATAAAMKKRQEEEKAKSTRLTRSQLLSKALKRCKKVRSKHKRTHCEKLAKKKYGGQKKHKPSKT
jgi:hypothetical protein